ncbi:MAG TPA: methyltransferase, partial [Pseudolabrys sp.]
MSNDLLGFFQGTEMPDATWWQALFPKPAQILTLAGLAPGMDAVDLCSGDGWFTLPMAKIARHVMAVDIDAKMLAHASTRLA